MMLRVEWVKGASGGLIACHVLSRLYYRYPCKYGGGPGGDGDARK